MMMKMLRLLPVTSLLLLPSAAFAQASPAAAPAAPAAPAGEDAKGAQSDDSGQAEAAPVEETTAAVSPSEAERIAQLEARLEALEAERAQTAKKLEASKEESSNGAATKKEETLARIERREEYMKREFKNNTEVRTQYVKEQEHYIDKLEEIMNGYVDIAGYFRAGYGRDDRGGAQIDFQAPGSMAKYRLGNESNNFGEIVFGKNIYLPGLFSSDRDERPSGVPTGPIARIQFRADFFNSYDDFSVGSNTSVGLPEAWASIGNVIKSQPSAKFWAGNRYYRRQDIHLNDFFFWNMSGGGGGIEDIQIGEAKLAVAWIGIGSNSGISDGPAPDAQNEAGYTKTNIDFRIYDLPMLAGNGEIGIIYSAAKSGLDADGNKALDTSGVSFNFVHKIPGFISDDGQNRFTVQFGTGAAKTFNTTFERITTDQGVFIRPDDPGSWRIRIMDDFTANINEHFSIGPVAIYQLTDFGNGQGRQRWVSGGIRPIAHINRFFSVALEGGVDWVKDDALGTDGALYKVTLAPQVSLGNRFFSRPSVRAFVTWSTWGDDFVGQVGGNDYTDRNYGFNFGMQMEAWF